LITPLTENKNSSIRNRNLIRRWLQSTTWNKRNKAKCKLKLLPVWDSNWFKKESLLKKKHLRLQKMVSSSRTREFRQSMNECLLLHSDRNFNKNVLKLSKMLSLPQSKVFVSSNNVNKNKWVQLSGLLSVKPCKISVPIQWSNLWKKELPRESCRSKSKWL
jgi:hypothetical protein